MPECEHGHKIAPPNEWPPGKCRACSSAPSLAIVRHIPIKAAREERYRTYMAGGPVTPNF